MARLGRPKAHKKVLLNFRMSELERDDLRRCAIAEGLTMADFLRDCIRKCKRRHKEKGDWPEETDR